MLKKDCKIGTRVGLVSTTYPCLKGTVKGQVEINKNSEVAIVEWDNGSLQKVNLVALITEQKGYEQDIRIKAEHEKLEADWNNALKLARTKLKEAADAVKEAKRLAENTGHDLLDMYDDVYPLMQTLRISGWSSSSLSC